MIIILDFQSPVSTVFGKPLQGLCWAQDREEPAPERNLKDLNNLDPRCELDRRVVELDGQKQPEL